MRQCLPMDQCPGLGDVIWGGFVGNNIIGKDGVHLNTRMYYDSSEGLMDAGDHWTVFLMVDHQLHSSIGNLSISASSLEADFVGHHVESDCSSTVFQFQSNTFHGPDFSNRRRRGVTFEKDFYHQMTIDLNHLDFWQLDTVTVETVDAYFDKAKFGWLPGHHPDLTWCIAEHFSERPPAGTKISEEYPTDNARCRT